jgi:small conductance mechanosensitive channel
MENIMGTVSGYVIQYGMSVVAAVVIFIAGKWLAQLSSRLIGQVMGRSKINDTLVSFTKNIVYYIFLIFVAIAALNKLGVETTSFVAIVGAAGLAVGLALQGSLSNFAAGVMLILFQPFKVGDEIEAGGASGIVQEIQIFSTIMIAKDKKKVIVPNARIAADKITITPH